MRQFERDPDVTTYDWKAAPPDWKAIMDDSPDGRSFPFPGARMNWQSVFYRLGSEDFRRLPLKPGHPDIANWLGVIRAYEDIKGVLGGQEFDFFGQDPVLKFWGLKGEERYTHFAVLHEGQWKIFQSKLFEPAIIGIAPDQDPAFLVGARISAKDLRKDKQEILAVTVWREDRRIKS